MATIDLTLGKLNVGSEAEALAIAQLVWTATAADPSVTRISLTVGGKKVESIAGHVDATKPFTRGPTYAVLAPVWIISPSEGEQKMAQGFTLSGMASTFEANVAWKVYLDGKLLKEGSTLAAEAAPAWKPWSVAPSFAGTRSAKTPAARRHATALLASCSSSENVAADTTSSRER